MLREHLRVVTGAASPSQGGESWSLPSGAGPSRWLAVVWFLLEPGLTRRLEEVCGGVGAGRNILLVLGLHAHPSLGPGWFGGAVPQWLDSRFCLAETPALTLTGCGSVAGGQSPASSFPLGP